MSSTGCRDGPGAGDRGPCLMTDETRHLMGRYPVWLISIGLLIPRSPLFLGLLSVVCCSGLWSVVCGFDRPFEYSLELGLDPPVDQSVYGI